MCASEDLAQSPQQDTAMSLHGRDETVSGKNEIDDVGKKLLEDLKNVLPNLPINLLQDLARELETNFHVYSLDDDLPFTDEKELCEIKVLKVAQKKKFLQYAEGLRNQSKKKSFPTKKVVAIGFEGDSDKATKFNMKGQSQLSVVATGGGAQSSDNEDIAATGFRGGESVTLEGRTKASVIARAGDADYSNANLIAGIKENLTLPDEKIPKLVTELAEKLGVHDVVDLQYVNAEDLKKLESLTGVQMNSFIDYANRVKDWCRGKNDTSKPPAGMYG